MTGVRDEEPKIADPSSSPEPDLRLTLREWVILWKTKYERTLDKLHEAGKFLDSVKAEYKKMKAERDEWKKKFEALDAQYRDEQAKREVAAKAEAPAIVASKSEAKRLRAVGKNARAKGE